jgi:hypothetical protein
VAFHLGACLGDVAWAAALLPAAIPLHLIHAAADLFRRYVSATVDGGCHDAEGVALDAGAELLPSLAAMITVEVAATIQGVAADGL